MTQIKKQKRGVILWLAVVCLLVFTMVIVGGVTRLTHSGLSMVDWRPLLGWLPPLTDATWQAVFARYQQFPEYLKINSGMGLDEFKLIYYWEYTHRLLGRLIGLAYALPLAYFWFKGCLGRALEIKLILALILGALQGLMGWYMVQSGLVDVPRVSHYRLAAHLLLALLIMGFLFWVILGLWTEEQFGALSLGPGSRPDLAACTSLALTLLLVLQIIYGAFSAGLHAGWGYNSFPDMDGHLLPEAAFRLSPIWLNFLENPVMVQFVHRLLGTVALVLGWVLLVRVATGKVDRRLLPGFFLLAIAILVQYLAGVYTLLNGVPLVAASVHQAMACVLLLSSLFVTRQCFLIGGICRK